MTDRKALKAELKAETLATMTANWLLGPRSLGRIMMGAFLFVGHVASLWFQDDLPDTSVVFIAQWAALGISLLLLFPKLMLGTDDS